MIGKVLDTLTVALGGGILFVAIVGIGLAITDTPYPRDAQFGFALMGMVTFGAMVAFRHWQNARSAGR